MAVIGCFPGGMGGSSLLIAAVPSQSGTLVYNGSEQTPTWANYDENQLIISGEISATNAGTYTVTFTPRANCYWSNGTSEGRTATWTIAKAQGSISLDKTEIEISGSETADIEVTKLGDGEINAESSDSDHVTVAVNGTTVTVSLGPKFDVAEEIVTVAIYVAEGTNYFATDKQNITVTYNAYAEELENNSWAIISEAAKAGYASSVWAVGDRKGIELNGTVGNADFDSDVFYAYILGFDHNADLEGYNLIHFQFGFDSAIDGNAITFYSSKFYMISSSSTTSLGWNNSYLRNNICPQFKNVLPSDLQDVIASVTKYTHNHNGASMARSYVTATTDEIFIPSEYEVFGKIQFSSKYEEEYQKEYEYFSIGNSVLRYSHLNSSTARAWWERSAACQYTPTNYPEWTEYSYCQVNNLGQCSAMPAINDLNETVTADSESFSPCFCVGGTV